MGVRHSADVLEGKLLHGGEKKSTHWHWNQNYIYIHMYKNIKIGSLHSRSQTVISYTQAQKLGYIHIQGHFHKHTHIHNPWFPTHALHNYKNGSIRILGSLGHRLSMLSKAAIEATEHTHIYSKSVLHTHTYKITKAGSPLRDSRSHSGHCKRQHSAHRRRSLVHFQRTRSRGTTETGRRVSRKMESGS